MPRRVISRMPWVYSIVEEDGRFYFEAVCGGAALYEKRVEISEQEAIAYSQNDERAREFAQKLEESGSP